MLRLGSDIDIVAAWQPLDLQTARSGDWVSLKNCMDVGILIFKGAGTDNDDPTFTVEQASDVAGTGSKALSVISQYWEKEALTDLTGTGVWTRVAQAAASTVAPGDPSAQSVALYYLHVEADQLDVDNGFDCLRVTCSDVGSNAQLGCALYLLGGLRSQRAPELLPNSIAD